MCFSSLLRAGTGGSSRGRSGWLFLLLVPAATLVAQGGPPGNGAPPDLRSSELSLTVVQQFSADLDDGGELEISRVRGGFGSSWVLDRRSRIGVSFDYGIDRYDFNGMGSLGAEPWEEIHQTDLALNYFRRLDNGWLLFVRPGIGVASEEGAFDGDGLLYNVIIGGQQNVGEDLNLGVGLVAASGLEETRLIPFLSIRWQIAENWVVQNPFRPGPAGPAGLEIAYQSERWSVAAGAAYRSWRFRIEGMGPTEDGIAEYEGAPVFVRATVPVNETFAFDLYGGVMLGADIEIEDESGGGLGLEDSLDAAPFLALAFSGRF